MQKQTATKRHPLMRGESTLDFGGDFDSQALTPEQEMDAFLSKYMDVMDPVGTYGDYFKGSAKEVDHILRDVKLYHRKLVLEGTWSERKYAQVLHGIFTKRLPITLPVLDREGLIQDRAQGGQRRRRSA